MHGGVRVLVVDDSAFMRRLISSILAAESGIQVIGQARDGAEALRMTLAHKPDVITLDVEMPGTDGFQALKAIMAEQPTPVVMLSSLTREGAEATIRCLELGAIDFVAKPSGSISLDLSQVGADLVARVRSAATSSLAIRGRKPVATVRRTSDAIHPQTKCVFIGCSTGGPRALRMLIPKLPGDLGVPVMVVQHMPPGFTHALAERLDAESSLTVREANAGDRLTPNRVLIAPGGFHTTLTAGGEVKLLETPTIHGVRPAADITLAAIVERYGASAMGVILTGMGRDGAASMKLLRTEGGRTVVESEETCVVYGMPRAVVEIGAADLILPLPEIADEITRSARSLRMAS